MEDEMTLERPKSEYVLQFLNPDGEPFCTINLDGSVTYSEDYEVHIAANDAALILWNAIEKLFIANVKSMVKEELEAVYKGAPPMGVFE